MGFVEFICCEGIAHYLFQVLDYQVKVSIVFLHVSTELPLHASHVAFPN